MLSDRAERLTRFGEAIHWFLLRVLSSSWPAYDDPGDAWPEALLIVRPGPEILPPILYAWLASEGPWERLRSAANIHPIQPGRSI